MTAISDKANAAWSRIIPFLRPIEPLLRDADVSDIMVNGEQAVFFEKHGIIHPFPDVTIREQSLQVAARNIARALGDEIGEERPILDSRLPDGSRVAIVLGAGLCERHDDHDSQVSKQALPCRRVGPDRDLKS